MIRSFARLFGLAIMLIAAAPNVGVAAPLPQDFYISFRSLTTEQVPHFLAAAPAPSGQYVTAFQACDGNTYYLDQADAQSLQAALANRDTVQLHATNQGAPPQSGGIVCLIQAGQ